MPADLSGVRRKLARAKDKLDKLSDAVKPYLDTTPFRIEVDVQGNHQAVVCRVDPEPEESWADDMAEIAYQARSALDLLIRSRSLAIRQRTSRRVAAGCHNETRC
jgi:hypothetical protein